MKFDEKKVLDTRLSWLKAELCEEAIGLDQLQAPEIAFRIRKRETERECKYFIGLKVQRNGYMSIFSKSIWLIAESAGN